MYKSYKAAGHDVAGWANTRPSGELKKVDLLNPSEVEHAVADFKPDCECRSHRRDMPRRDVLTHILWARDHPLRGGA